MNRFTLWILISSLFVLCVILGKSLYNSVTENRSLTDDIIQLQSTLSMKPKIIKVDSIVYNDRIFNVYKAPKINQSNTASKLLAVGDKKKLDSLNKILGIKTKDLLTYKEINMGLMIKNQKLEQNLKNPSKIEYKDNYITLIIDRENNVIDTLSHKINLLSTSYEKRPKWYKSKEEFYVVSADDKRVNLDVTGFDSKPKVIKSMFYIDNRYQIDPTRLIDGTMSSTLNYEWGMDNIFSGYIGGGIQTDFQNPVRGVANVGIKINIIKNKK